MKLVLFVLLLFFFFFFLFSLSLFFLFLSYFIPFTDFVNGDSFCHESWLCNGSSLDVMYVFFANIALALWNTLPKEVRFSWWWWWCRASCPRMSVTVLGTNCDQCQSMVQCCFTSTETVRPIRTESQARPPQVESTSHSSSWTLTFRSPARPLYITTELSPLPGMKPRLFVTARSCSWSRGSVSV